MHPLLSENENQMIKAQVVLCMQKSELEEMMPPVLGMKK
jgi:hypothetical protein